MFGHERDLGCVFESPFFQRKSTWDCTSHRGWSVVWGQRGSWGLVTENSSWEVLIFHPGYMKWPGLKPRVWWIWIFPKNTSAFRSNEMYVPGLSGPGPLPVTSSSARYFDKTRQAKMRMKRSSFATKLVLLEKGWDRMRKDEKGRWRATHLADTCEISSDDFGVPPNLEFPQTVTVPNWSHIFWVVFQIPNLGTPWNSSGRRNIGTLPSQTKTKQRHAACLIPGKSHAFSVWYLRMDQKWKACIEASSPTGGRWKGSERSNPEVMRSRIPQRQTVRNWCDAWGAPSGCLESNLTTDSHFIPIFDCRQEKELHVVGDFIAP